ncbi:AzlC family ABC transporter permease [Nesterenkonia sp. LB17]|uniref:AzlC family ABC transporter permease n=1 Tax=unclassified Nesterenkonia TaxID=2629769 RepID=UPI001F4D0B32|nr:AzlC family ABC transporter permease [Nesterenkonia sp. DZ6]MCH8562979.1 AzlC family ABC transporter permease [Nesterenkonia sp. YGD6]MCH8566017.1 AzlC family ABC transporter permease [Nesterenkonia sp. LB17]
MSAPYPPVSTSPPVPLRRSPALRTGLSIAAAISLYGVSFGALSTAAGMTLWQTVALSALLFSGASQFAFIGILASGGTGAAALGAATLLSGRNTIYAVQMKALLNPRGFKRLAAAQVTIDESAAVAMSAPDPVEQRRGFWGAGIACYLFWNLATVLGALLGDVIAEPEALGLDGAVVAAFLGLLWPRLKSLDAWALAVLAALVTTVTMPLLAPGVPVLAAAVVAVVWGLASKGVRA